MSVDRAVMAFAGFVILVSLALGQYTSAWWFLLTAFAGLNLMQASVTGFCPAAIAFKSLGPEARRRLRLNQRATIEICASYHT